MITKGLIELIVRQLALTPDGEHGVAHWARVLENGRRLARRTGACLPVVELFAVLHDARRFTDAHDPLHGMRAADLCLRLRNTALDLDDHAFELLWYACAYHAHGFVNGDVTVQTCWDADRLDYERDGTPLETHHLCTAAAREPATIAWATERARRNDLPPLVTEEWGIARISRGSTAALPTSPWPGTRQ